MKGKKTALLTIINGTNEPVDHHSGQKTADDGLDDLFQLVCHDLNLLSLWIQHANPLNMWIYIFTKENFFVFFHIRLVSLYENKKLKILKKKFFSKTQNPISNSIQSPSPNPLKTILTPTSYPIYLSSTIQSHSQPQKTIQFYNLIFKTQYPI